MTKPVRFHLLLVLAMAGCAQAVPPAEPPLLTRPGMARGAMLYENHCTKCHTSVVHVQKDQSATSDLEVEKHVRFWATDQRLEWSDEEIVDVTDYLIERFYKF